MATTFLEPGCDATFTTGLYTVESGAPVVATDFVHGNHVKSIQARPNAAADTLGCHSVVTDAGGRVSIWLYIVALPGAECSLCSISQASFGTSNYKIRITTTGAIKVTDNANTQLGISVTTLSTGQWYRISLADTITSTTVNEFRFFINGSSEASLSLTNKTLTAATSNEFWFGNGSGDTTFNVRFSDLYIDNSNALTDPGNIWVTAKRPFSNGTTNGFTTGIGADSGSPYGSGHAIRENERPNNDANGWSFTTVATPITEEYNLESVSQGDINITGATIVDYMGWVRSGSALSETAQIIVNNVSSSISLTSTITFFTKIAGSSTYPAGTGTDIGEISSNTATTISLYECGIIVAYTPAAVNFGPVFISKRAMLGIGT